MAYYRGDYYRGRPMRGDYYRGRSAGDPFWGAILRAATTVGKMVMGIGGRAVPAVEAATAGASGSVIRATAGKAIATIPKIARGAIATVGKAPQIVKGAAGAVAAGGLMAIGGKLVDMATGEVVGNAPHRRRINPANVKALRRSLSRVSQFGRLCHRARASVNAAAACMHSPPRRRSGGTAIARASASSRR